jgi:hypothetical protein
MVIIIKNTSIRSQKWSFMLTIFLEWTKVGGTVNIKGHFCDLIEVFCIIITIQGYYLGMQNHYVTLKP